MVITLYLFILTFIICCIFGYYFSNNKNYLYAFISYFIGIIILFYLFNYINIIVSLICENIAIDVMKGVSQALTGNCAECCPVDDSSKPNLQVLDIIRQQVDCNTIEVFKDTNRSAIGSGEFTTLLDPKTGKSFSRICLGPNEINSLVNQQSIPLPFRGSVIHTLQKKCFCFETASNLREAFDSIREIVKK